MKYKVNFESLYVGGIADQPYYKGILANDMADYSKMFDSGIRINKGDIIHLRELGDYLDGFYGEEKQKKAKEWCGKLDFDDIIKCYWVEFLPRIEHGYIEVLVCLGNPE